MTIEETEKWEAIVAARFSPLLEERKAGVGYSSEVMDKMWAHDMDAGAVFGIIVGSTGMSKTSVLFSIMEKNLDLFPDQLVWFSECYDAPLQFTKLPRDRIHLMVQADCCRFVDRVKKQECSPEHTVFSDYADAYSKAKHGKVNVLFLPDRRQMMDFIGWARTNAMDWNFFGIDELSEVVPSYASGETYKKIEKFSYVLKDCRKSLINIFATVQSASLVDFKCLHMHQILIYMPGSMQYRHSRIFQSLLDSLRADKINGNPAIIEGFSRFCKTRFDRIYKPDYKNMMHASLKEEFKKDDNK